MQIKTIKKISLLICLFSVFLIQTIQAQNQILYTFINQTDYIYDYSNRIIYDENERNIDNDIYVNNAQINFADINATYDLVDYSFENITRNSRLERSLLLNDVDNDNFNIYLDNVAKYKFQSNFDYSLTNIPVVGAYKYDYSDERFDIISYTENDNRDSIKLNNTAYSDNSVFLLQDCLPCREMNTFEFSMNIKITDGSVIISNVINTFHINFTDINYVGNLYYARVYNTNPIDYTSFVYTKNVFYNILLINELSDYRLYIIQENITMELSQNMQIIDVNSFTNENNGYQIQYVCNNKTIAYLSAIMLSTNHNELLSNILNINTYKFDISFSTTEPTALQFDTYTALFYSRPFATFTNYTNLSIIFYLINNTIEFLQNNVVILHEYESLEYLLNLYTIRIVQPTNINVTMYHYVNSNLQIDLFPNSFESRYLINYPNIKYLYFQPDSDYINNPFYYSIMNNNSHSDYREFSVPVVGLCSDLAFEITELDFDYTYIDNSSFYMANLYDTNRKSTIRNIIKLDVESAIERDFTMNVSKLINNASINDFTISTQFKIIDNYLYTYNYYENNTYYSISIYKSINDVKIAISTNSVEIGSVLIEDINLRNNDIAELALIQNQSDTFLIFQLSNIRFIGYLSMFVRFQYYENIQFNIHNMNELNVISTESAYLYSLRIDNAITIDNDELNLINYVNTKPILILLDELNYIGIEYYNDISELDCYSLSDFSFSNSSFRVLSTRIYNSSYYILYNTELCLSATITGSNQTYYTDSENDIRDLYDVNQTSNYEICMQLSLIGLTRNSEIIDNPIVFIITNTYFVILEAYSSFFEIATNIFLPIGLIALFPYAFSRVMNKKLGFIIGLIVSIIIFSISDMIDLTTTILLSIVTFILAVIIIKYKKRSDFNDTIDSTV